MLPIPPPLNNPHQTPYRSHRHRCPLLPYRPRPRRRCRTPCCPPGCRRCTATGTPGGLQQGRCRLLPLHTLLRHCSVSLRRSNGCSQRSRCRLFDSLRTFHHHLTVDYSVTTGSLNAEADLFARGRAGDHDAVMVACYCPQSLQLRHVRVSLGEGGHAVG